MKIKKIKNNLIFYSEKYMSRNLFPIIVVIFLFNYQACQDFDEDTMKALGCLSLIRKLDNDKQQDQRMVSAYLQSCFVNIEESQVQTLGLREATYKQTAKILVSSRRGRRG